MQEAFAGIDVACAKRKRLPIAVVVNDGRGGVQPLRLRNQSLPMPPRSAGNVAALDEAWLTDFAVAVDKYLRDLERHFDIRICRVAIDAPSDPCSSTRTRRRAEVALDAAGISCFATPTAAAFETIKSRVRTHLAAGGAESRLPHANQLWMLVGFALFRQLRRGFECLEVYPQAIVKTLGAHLVHKRKSEGLLAQLRAFRVRTAWPSVPDPTKRDLIEVGFGRPDDNLDACLSAWVASLPVAERVLFGAPPDDVIWVPRGECGKTPES